MFAHFEYRHFTTSLSTFRRGNGQQGFVPANYVREIEPAKITQKVTKTVMEKVPVKVKKRQVVKRRSKGMTRNISTRTFSCKQE